MKPAVRRHKHNKPMNASNTALSAQLARSRYRCLIFDMDGTLLDTRAAMLLALNEVLAERGLPVPTAAQLEGSLHYGLPAMLTQALEYAPERLEHRLDPAHRSALEAQLMETYLLQTAAKVHVYAGAAELLQRLQDDGVWMAICTNQSERSAQRLLAASGLRTYFQAVVGGDTFACRKPDPTPLLWLIEQSGLPPGQAVMVGDSEVDVRCAQRAGVDIIVMSHGYGGVGTEAQVPHMASFASLDAALFLDA